MQMCKLFLVDHRIWGRDIATHTYEVIIVYANFYFFLHFTIFEEQFYCLSLIGYHYTLRLHMFISVLNEKWLYG